MRIRSVLAATVLAVALAATGATTAGAHGRDDDSDESKDREAVCSEYSGQITSLENTISWAGTHCRGSLH
ncbi:hypothetical protein ACH4NF_05165 [Streptomyces sp. NPDC017248]|uniref:hypothetical protein n=1 Tax=unclassified Streptomyces TaxID=2593676 RepID=UPI00341FC236